jgi:hypothetical protein
MPVTEPLPGGGRFLLVSLRKQKLLPRRHFIKLFSIILPTCYFFGVASVLANGNLRNLIDALRSLKKPVCDEAANRIEKWVQTSNFYNLHLRSAMLSTSDAKKIADALKSIHQNQNIQLKSFSVSYNPTLGLSGAASILSSLPLDVEELGMVGCDLGDETGKHLVDYIRRAKNLVMVCVEKNNFSQKLKDEILDLRRQKNNCTIIV